MEIAISRTAECTFLEDAMPPSQQSQENKASIMRDTNHTGGHNICESSVQYGVQAAQALASTLSRRELIVIYLLIWVAMFVYDMSTGVTRLLNPYVTSAFEEHSLTATTSVIASFAGGISQIPYAKLIDVWGRIHGLAVMVLFMTVGTAMMAACQNVETYCVAQVFYNIGSYCISFSITLFVADTTPLRSRAILIGFTSSPSIITNWLHGPIAEGILDRIGFRFHANCCFFLASWSR
ncbi:siderophore iron transporter-like protein mirB [Penicillium antarcticum]|uniref:siderophore iron transporter-like protein mirB n=1 Tax=Penicillium antarcticum TaxID=416450 RepID=UPI0023A4D379|nr:siderophore iron transporter-like protein mirB [Penicillium antarcticum]KAJ5301246.1 siderophore iron transporter-like protein mirB [Penicillium antarcticum]